MCRPILSCCGVLLAAVTALAPAQWKHVRTFPSSDFRPPSGIHGIAVDPAGKVWIQPFGATTTIFDGGRDRSARQIFVYNADGSPASFSGFATITVGSVTDTLFSDGRGLRTDHEGNILIAVGSGTLYRVNYQTGAGMAQSVISPGISLTAPGVTGTGDVVIGNVLANTDVRILDADLAVVGTAFGPTNVYARSMEVTSDGNDIFWGGFPNHCVYKYHSTSGIAGPYTLQDTVLKGFDVESFCWNPKTGHLWASAGSFNDPPNRYPGTATAYSAGSWYAYNIATGAIEDSLAWQFTFPENMWERPRAIAFSPGGDTAYVGVYGSGQILSTRMYVRPTVPILSLDSPNGEEVWLAGASCPIRWTSNLIPAVKLEYSVNNGSSWTTIIASTAAAPGSYPWLVPAIPSSGCLVRISDAAVPTRFDSSDEPFTISTTGPPQETEPNNTASQAHMLAYGDSIDAIIDPGTDVDYFSFTASAGDTVEISATNTDASVDIALWLYNAAGELVGENDDFLTNTQCRLVYVVQQGGTHFVRCAYYDRAGAFPNSSGTRPGSDVSVKAGDGQHSITAGIWSYRLWIRRFVPSAPILDPPGMSTICDTQALLIVHLYPNGLPTNVSVEFGTTTAYGSTVAAINNPVDGLWDGFATMVLAPLTPATTYHYRVTAANPAGTAISDDMTFDTPPAASGWSVANIGNGAWLLGVDYADPLNGRAVGPDLHSMMTSDGGATWHYTSAGGSILGLNFEAVAAHTSSSATVVGYTIYRVTGTYEWTEQGNPTGVYLRSVAFSSAQSGFAVGNMGTIIHTTDGGELWSAQTSGTSAQLRGVACVGDATAWAVGGSGTIVHTTDGGTSWAGQSSGTTQQLNGVCFVNSTIGIAVGNGGTIRRTTDGGAIWAAASSGTSVQLNAVSFSDELHGIVVGNSGTILRSTDGGATWTPEASGTTAPLLGAFRGEGDYTTVVGGWGLTQHTTSAVAVVIPNGAEVWPAGSSRTIHWVSRGISNVHLEYSTDDGATWTTIVASTPAADASYAWTVPATVSSACRVRVSDAADATLIDASNAPFAIVTAASTTETEPNNSATQANYCAYGDSLDGSITPAGDVDYFMFSGAAGDTVDIYATNREDGNVDGQLWLYDAGGQEIATKHNYNGTNAEHRIVHILPVTGMYYIRFSYYQTYGSFPNSGPGEELRPPAETDAHAGGRPAFVTAPTDPIGEGEYRIRLKRFVPAAPMSLTGIVSVGRWWDASSFIGSVDPGGLATTVTFEYGLTEAYGGSVGIPGTTITALREEGFISNAISGLTPETTYHFRMVASNSEGSAASSDFTFTTPAGPPTKWQRVASGSTEALYAVAFAGLSHGIVVGSGGTGLRTTDRGYTWMACGDMGGSDLYGVSTPSTGRAYAVGASGSCWRSSNGGVSWALVSTGVSVSLNGVCFPQENVGTAVGHGGTIVRTTDGGSTWIQQSSGVGDILGAVDFVNANVGIAVGRNGRILRTTDGGEHWVSQTSGTTVFLRAVSLLDESTAICGGANGVILKTTDGGGVWIPLTAGTTEHVNAVHMTSSSHAWAAGKKGTLLSTEDGGSSWTADVSGTDQDLLGMTFAAQSLGMVTGSWGKLLRSISTVPVWSANLTVTDAGSGSGVVTCGQATPATNGIDSELGEVELPPVPPGGIFDARLIIPEGIEIGSLKDFRSDTCTTAVWRLAFKPGSGGYPMTVTWTAADLPAGSFILKDEFGGAIVNVNMKTQNSCTVTNTGVVALRIEHTSAVTTHLTVLEGWNMVSAPVTAPDMSPEAMFPDATSAAFAFAGGYVEASTLAPGRGYWLKFGDAHTIAITGVEPTSREVAVGSGWNLIGTFEFDTPVSSITSTPPGIVTSDYFGFTSGYASASTLTAGKAYWVKTSQGGTLFMPAGVPKVADPDPGAPAPSLQVQFVDHRGMRGAILLLAADDPARVSELPPLPPHGVFDVRFAGNVARERLGQKRHEILLHGAEFPLRVQATHLGGIGLVLRDAVDGTILNVVLHEGTPVTLTRPLDRLMLVELGGEGGTPTAFALWQNYPNPFNPTTMIRFDLPEPCTVVITLYNTIGQSVREVNRKDMEAGYHAVVCDAAGLASGVYFYRMQAGGFVALKKLIVLR